MAPLPAFDLNPNPQPAPFQTSLLGEDTRRGRAAALMATAAEFGVPKRDAQAAAASMAKTVGQWRAVALSLGVPPGEVDLMEPAFAAVPR